MIGRSKEGRNEADISSRGSRLRRVALGGVLAAILPLQACGISQDSGSNNQPTPVIPNSSLQIPNQASPSFAYNTQKGASVDIGVDTYDGQSIFAHICGVKDSNGYITIASKELQGDARDVGGRRWLVSETHTYPTGNVGSESDCLNTHPDIQLAQGVTTEVDVFVGIGNTPDASFQGMEEYDVTYDANGVLHVQDKGTQSINPIDINTSQASP